MESMYTHKLKTIYGEKTIEVFLCDIVDLDMEIDVLVTSAFRGSYAPTPNTLFAALSSLNISVEKLSVEPEIDLRNLCNLWLSKEINNSSSKIRRIGCVEMSSYSYDRTEWRKQESDILTSIKANFKMLDIASTVGIKTECIALPLLGAGSQKISSNLTLIPLINESTEFLKHSEHVKKICFIDYNPKNAFAVASTIQKMYSVQKKEILDEEATPIINSSDAKVFISYTQADKNLADNLCAKLEYRGIKVWYAPRNILGEDYASAIVQAISTCTHFVTIISKNSMMSEHVLNEIDLAFGELRRNIRFFPLRIDLEELRPAFSYYLSRQHWMDAHIPPIELRLEEFVEKIANELS